MFAESLLDIERQPVTDVLAGFKDESENVSAAAGTKVIKAAKNYGVSLRDYLTLAVQPDAEAGLNGYETALAHLNLPVKDDFENGILLQAASETFQTYSGTRALFPEVMDDVLRWVNRQAIFEDVANIVANSRTMTGNELVRTVVNDDSAERDTFTVAEGARIPVRTIRTGEQSVKMWKHGSGIRTTYEFNRRARLDIIAPFAARIVRELQLSKMTAAVNVIVNGDGTNAAADTYKQVTAAGVTDTAHAAGRIVFENLVYWLLQRAKAGTPVDTVIGNYDAAFEWARMWKVDGSETTSDADNAGRVIGQLGAALGEGFQLPLPRFVVATAAPAGKLVGLTRGETLEELVEAGANIEESERSILNQTMTMVKSENTGYSLVYGDTRSIYDYTAAS